jgi:hypothetical protein
MFCPVSNNVLLMWVCYVCGHIYELSVHIPKLKKVHGICRQKASFVVHAPPHTPTLLERLNCKFENENNERKRSRDMLLILQHFGGRGAC